MPKHDDKLITGNLLYVLEPIFGRTMDLIFVMSYKVNK